VKGHDAAHKEDGKQQRREQPKHRPQTNQEAAAGRSRTGGHGVEEAADGHASDEGISRESTARQRPRRLHAAGMQRCANDTSAYRTSAHLNTATTPAMVAAGIIFGA